MIIFVRVLMALSVMSLVMTGCAGVEPATPTGAAGQGTPTASIAAIVPASTPTIEQATATAVRSTATPAAVTSLPLTASVLLTPSPESASPQAIAYLTEVVDYIEQHALRSDRVDWDTVRQVVFGPQQRAQVPADTYPSIRYVLSELGDRHSFFLTPNEVASIEAYMRDDRGLYADYSRRVVTEVKLGGPAELAGVREGDTILTLNGVDIAELGAARFFTELYSFHFVRLSLSRVGESEPINVTIVHTRYRANLIPDGRRIGSNIGYLALPGLAFSPLEPYYAGIAHQIIEEISASPVCGWVVDLQTNTGGHMWHMLAAVGPILGEGLVGSFNIVGGEDMPWFYRQGQSLLGETVLSEVANPYPAAFAQAPVAVLTSGRTASAGEATMIAFRGRPNSRTFGAPTSGVPTAVHTSELDDGALLFLTEGTMVDRTGQDYDDKIPPDQLVTGDEIDMGTESDPVLLAAVEWLELQPACSNK